MGYLETILFHRFYKLLLCFVFILQDIFKLLMVIYLDFHSLWCATLLKRYPKQLPAKNTLSHFHKVLLVSFSLLFGLYVKTQMQYKIAMKYEDAHTKTKVFTDQEIPKKLPSCQVRYLVRISYISRHMQFSEVIKN